MKNEVGEYLVEAIISEVGKARSPVAGESWPSLSKKYKEKKISEGLPGKANMEFQGDMLESLTFKTTASGIEVGFFDSEAWKADGHLKFSGEENNTPKRRFLPAEGQQFDSRINSEIEQIVADAVANDGEVDPADLTSVETREDLYDVLEDAFPGLSRSEIRDLVDARSDISRLLEREGLLDLL